MTALTHRFKAKFLDISKKNDGDSATGEVTVRASSFGNEDVVGDVFERGAFDGDLGSGQKLKMLWQHDQYEPIGHWTDVWVDDKYLMMKGNLTLDVPQAARAYANLKAGDIDAVSIGFKSLEERTRFDDDGRFAGYTYEKVKLWECSVVTFPANDLARVSNVKALQSQKEFERILREAGFSRDGAKVIVAEGYRSYALKFGAKDNQREAGGLTSLSDLDWALKNQTPKG